jgi:hypothetical protein
MKVAVVLYGQPRNYIKGYNNIKQFIDSQTNCSFDFFYHCWSLNENDTYIHSTYRDIDKNELIYKKDIITDLQELYNPISYEVDNQSNLTLDCSLCKSTIAYNNTSERTKPNIKNTLFQMFSRNKARNLLHEYLEKMNNTVYYEFVLTLRFDIGELPKIQVNELNKTKVYISNIHYPRKITPDNCIIAPTNIYLKWFNIFDRLSDIFNNAELSQALTNLNETLIISPEEIILAKYILHYKNTNDISFFQGGNL